MKLSLRLLSSTVPNFHLMINGVRASNLFSKDFNIFLERTEAAILGGVNCIHYRPNGDDSSIISKHMYEFRKLCSLYGVKLIVNTPYHLQHLNLASHVDGIWLDNPASNALGVRKHLGDKAFVGLSCNGMDGVNAANALPHGVIDAISVHSTFHSATLSSCNIGRGLGEVRQFKQESHLPVVVGGVGLKGTRAVVSTGVDAVAVSDDLLLSQDPQAAAARIAELLGITAIELCITDEMPF